MALASGREPSTSDVGERAPLSLEESNFHTVLLPTHHHPAILACMYKYVVQ